MVHSGPDYTLLLVSGVPVHLTRFPFAADSMWTGTLLIDLGNRSRVANNWQLFSLGRIGVGLAATAIFVHNDTMVEKLDAAFDNADSPGAGRRPKNPITATTRPPARPRAV